MVKKLLFWSDIVNIFSRFTLTGTSARQWSILVGEEKEVEVWLESSVQVSMIECSSRRLPPTGCLQYLTGPTGTVTSFNYRAGCTAHPCTHLQSQQYTVRGEGGSYMWSFFSRAFFSRVQIIKVLYFKCYFNWGFYAIF